MLPRNFIPRVKAHLIRLGRDNDGGYLVDNACLPHTDCLVSFGIDTDTSFEIDFLKQKNIKLFAYDHTTTYALFARKINFHALPKDLLNQCLSLKKRKYKWGFKKHHLKELMHYWKLKLSRRGKFYREKIGAKACETNLDTVMKRANSDNIFFKIDIEGGEYDILDDLIKYQSKITGLVIEFHDCGQRKSQIAHFIDRFQLPLVHIHSNNYAGIDEYKTAIVVELTFGDRKSKQHYLPPWKKHHLDQLNSKLEDEIPLVFEPLPTQDNDTSLKNTEHETTAPIS